MLYVMVLFSLLLTSPVIGERPVNYNPVCDPMPVEWGEIPENRGPIASAVYRGCRRTLLGMAMERSSGITSTRELPRP